MFLFGYREPFSMRNVRAGLIGAASFADSEINFYDGRVMFVGVDATYTF
jgi:hypothetical protein